MGHSIITFLTISILVALSFYSGIRICSNIFQKEQDNVITCEKTNHVSGILENFSISGMKLTLPTSIVFGLYISDNDPTISVSKAKIGNPPVLMTGGLIGKLVGFAVRSGP